MVEHDRISTTTPLFSIIIGVYDDWAPLDQCLQSLAQQTNEPTFEVIVMDDGSSEAAPESVRSWSQYYPLTIARHSHEGVSSARNRGIQISKGLVLLFVDADCRFQSNSLAALASTIRDSPEHNCFQLRLTGDCASLVGRAEELRLITFQDHMLQPDGCIRYLNTAGFAIRRAKVNVETGVFNPAAVRAEDTFLLAHLMLGGELPLFVTRAMVQHSIPLSLLACLRKDVQSARLEARTHDIIASKGVRIQVSHRERLRMMSSMWKTAEQPSIGKLAWFVVVARQGLRLVTLYLYRSLRIQSQASASTKS